MWHLIHTGIHPSHSKPIQSAIADNSPTECVSLLFAVLCLELHF